LIGAGGCLYRGLKGVLAKYLKLSSLAVPVTAQRPDNAATLEGRQTN